MSRGCTFPSAFSQSETGIVSLSPWTQSSQIEREREREMKMSEKKEKKELCVAAVADP